MNSYKANPIPVTVGNKHYSLLSNYQNQAEYRVAFNRLTEKVFDLTFESWYQDGYWKEKYIPYTLFNGEQAIANLSINIISALGTSKTDSILLGFTPKDTKGYEIKEKQDEDVLFVQKGKTDLFKNNKMMFPLLSHA